ncbi:hypothetical protein llap_16070 [Limosa lapponica baueri]|uniref:Reverse transcriptase/retrotransposon-derived protein RNase H-like domain-containing protein n=1 Tax=Limosa lapponica baueri TaxID=1758121 RepID=A0A2I0TIH5_LIMLA|nr:hypothetical protein llap_16070 [Limosa lapponica baueri]
MVDGVAGRLQRYSENLSSSLISAVEKLSWKFQQLEENMSYSPPIWAGISATRSRRFSAQERGYTPRGTLWFYLRDKVENMRKWDGQPTSTLEARNGCRQIPKDAINKIAAMSPPKSKKETQVFLGIVGFWRMHIPDYSLIVSPLYQVTQKKNNFKWGPEQRQAFEQIKQETAHSVALGAVRAGEDVKNVLYAAAGKNGLNLEPLAESTRGDP